MVAAVESMAYAGEVPWHGLGQKIDPTLIRTPEGMADAAGLNWSVTLVDLFMPTSNGEPKHVDGFYAVRRDTDNAVLGVVGSDYHPLQNIDAFKWFQPLINANVADYHTAGSLMNGEKVWVLAKLRNGEREVVPGDPIERYLLLSHAHNGKMSIRIGLTPIRVVCWNTLSMAHKSNESKLIRVLHSRKLHNDLNAIRDVVNVANADFEATFEQYRRLARKTINRSDLEKYVKLVLKIDDDKDSRILPNIARLFESGKGNSLKGVRGTVWAAYNAVTEYLSWESGRSNNNRMNSLWFGPAFDLNRHALTVALDMAV